MKTPKMKKVTSNGAGARRSGKQYLDRLVDVGIEQTPVTPQVKAVRQFQLAHLAATLADGTKNSAKDCVAKALEIWNAAGKALVVERQASDMVKGVLCLDEVDWQAHGKALTSSLNDGDGALPGQGAAVDVAKCHDKARCDAGAAVCRLWKHGPDNADALKALFSGKGESEEMRVAKFIGLLKEAKKAVETTDHLAWNSKDSDKLGGVIRQTWEPLDVPDESVFSKAVAQARQLLEKPDTGPLVGRFALNPLVARWLAVMRLEQLADSKKRPQA